MWFKKRSNTKSVYPFRVLQSTRYNGSVFYVVQKQVIGIRRYYWIDIDEFTDCQRATDLAWRLHGSLIDAKLNKVVLE